MNPLIAAIIKRTFTQTIALLCFVFVSLHTTAQTTPDFETPVGFASVNTGTTYPEFNGPVTGGQNATDTFWVNGPADFDALAWRLYYRNRAYRNLSGTNGVPKAPLVIVFMPGVYPEGTSTSSAWGNHMMTVQEQGDLTIIGKGNVTLKFGFNIKRSWNILIRNITFQDYYDDGINIGEPETHHIWVDHCTFGHPSTIPADSEHPDGGVDIKGGASYVTVSWCKFRNSWKTSLVGHSDNNGAQDEGKLKVTYFANHFFRTNSRNPRVRFGEVHLLNNLIEQANLYGAVAAKDAKVVAEANFYVNTRWPMYADRALADFQAVYGNNTDGVFTSKTGNTPCTYLKQFNNGYDDSGLPVITAQINPAMLNPGGRSVKFDELNAGAAFDPLSYYSYTPYTASQLRDTVPAYAGAGVINFLGAGDESNWIIYHANELPDAFAAAPFVMSQQTGTYSNTIVPDPDNAGNNLLHMQTTANSDNNQWRQNLVAGTQNLTVVFRAKGNSVTENLVFDADFDFGGFRWQTRILSNGNYAVANGTATSGIGSLGVDPLEWNIYRFTRNGNQGTLYINEEPAAVYTATAAAAGANNFFRFGDGWGTGFMNSRIDWIVWDTTGAYSPEQKQLPDELLNDDDEIIWTIYHANELPTAFTPAPFVTSQQSGTFSNTIVADPDLAGNNLLHMQTTANSDNNQWRQNLAPGTQDLTVVFRAKGNSVSENLVFDADLDFGGFRWQTRVLSNGNYGVANGTSTSGTGSLGIDPLQWNIYRFTRSGNQGTLYINEEPVAVYTATAAAAGSNNFFRFGDGWGSGFINTRIDWVVWNTSGAFSPSQAPLPDELFPTNDPVINVTASLSSFAQTVGSPSAVQTYTVSGGNLTGDITITPPGEYEVSADGGTTWFPRTSPLVLAQTGGSVAATVISVRLNATLEGNYEGDIVHSSTDADPVGVSVTGTTAANHGNWTIYHANELPDVFAAAPFVASQQSPTGISNTIVADPDEAGNNLLHMQTVVASNNQWRQNLTAGTQDITLVIRAKGNPATATLIFDADLDFGGARWQTRILSNGNYAVANGTATSGNGSLGIDPAAWNIYRFTKQGSSAVLYVNENPVAVYTATAASGTQNYFRFGDGWGSNNINSHIDWVAWDVTGAFSPVEAPLPPELAPGTDPVLTVTASLTSFAHVVGTPSAAQTYTVNGIRLTTDLTITPPAGFEVSADGGTNWFTNSSPLVLSPVSGSISSATISVRMNAAGAGAFAGNITHSTSSLPVVNVPVDGDATAVPVPEITITGTLSNFSQVIGAPSSTQTYTVSGINLNEDIIITPPAGYEVSANGGTNWFNNSSPLTLTSTSGVVGNTTITVRLNAASAASYTGNITHISAGAASQNVAVNGSAANPPPAISTTGTLSAFTQTIGAPSAMQTYTVSAINLTANVTVTPPAGYEISANAGANWFTNANPLVLTGTGGTLATTTITVRLNAGAAGNYNGNISHTSSGATTQNVAVSGSAVNPPVITATANLASFAQTIGAASAPQTFTVQGSNLVAAVIITPPVNYEVSLNNIDWFGSSNPLSITTGGTLASTTVRVRLNATTTGPHTGDITVQTAGTANQTIAVSGYTHSAMIVGPNPTRDLISIYHPYLFSAGDIHIYDANGNRVRVMRTTPASNRTDIDVRALPAGTYTIEYRRRDERETFRFIKL